MKKKLAIILALIMLMSTVAGSVFALGDHGFGGHGGGQSGTEEGDDGEEITGTEGEDITGTEGEDITGTEGEDITGTEGEGDAEEQEPAQDIVILYTSDVHCGIDENIGYAGLVSYKKRVEAYTDYVTLVDCGDAIQGDLIGVVSKGTYLMDLMNAAGYDLAILGNHEFDYGMQQLRDIVKGSNAEYLCCNLNYTGSASESLCDELSDYTVMEYGDTKVGFVGVSTPFSISQSTPAYFMEEDEFVYDFSHETDELFYETVQAAIDGCIDEGADYVVLLTHLGDSEDEFGAFSSVALIENTTGADVCLDAHEHSTIPMQVELNKDGEEVILSSTGTKLNAIGQLTISASGMITTTLVSSWKQKDQELQDYVELIKKNFEEETAEVIGSSDTELSIYDENGARMVRNRETAIGDFCADAYRAISGADIAIVNGGAIRDSIPEGDITFADVIRVFPFGNYATMLEVTGQQILDALELSAKNVQAETSDLDGAVGEFGGFLQVSGLRYSIDPTIESTVVMDRNDLFESVSGARRVYNVQVENENGEWTPIDPEGEYTLVSADYTILGCGDGYSMFKDDPVVLDAFMLDYQVLLSYLDSMDGEITGYTEPEGRITVAAQETAPEQGTDGPEQGGEEPEQGTEGTEQGGEEPEQGTEGPEQAAAFDPVTAFSCDSPEEGHTFVFNTLPQTKADMEALVAEYGLTDPNRTIAFYLAAYHRAFEDPAAACDMINVLMADDNKLTAYSTSFLEEQVKAKPYMTAAYFKGAAPENSYTPDEPYTVEIPDAPEDLGGDCYLVKLVTSGADSPRRTQAKLNADGNFYLLEYTSTLVDVIAPASLENWK